MQKAVEKGAEKCQKWQCVCSSGVQCGFVCRKMNARKEAVLKVAYSPKMSEK